MVRLLFYMRLLVFRRAYLLVQKQIISLDSLNELVQLLGLVAVGQPHLMLEVGLKILNMKRLQTVGIQELTNVTKGILITSE